MPEPFEITRRQLYSLVAAGIFIALLCLAAGFVIGKNSTFPQPFPTVEEIARRVPEDATEDDLPEELRQLRRTSPDETSGKPFVKNEGHSYYNLLKLGERTDTGPSEQTDSGGTVPPPPDDSMVTVQSVLPSIDSAGNTVESQNPAKAPVPDATPDPKATVGPDFEKAYVVQVHSVKKMKFAEDAKKKLVDKGFPAYVSKIRFNTGITNYRVRVGPYADKTTADSVSDAVIKTFHWSPLVVTVKNGEK
ncbi:SPOR domain-containing protein [bacterium]|nr:SPOR domain-containing protein [candidate division CSSED10-310 bacterium]